MLWTSEFDGGLPVGTSMQFAGMGPPESLWLLKDGRALSRAVAENGPLSELFPVGKLTGTLRTLAAIPNPPAVAIAATNHYLAAGVAGTAALQYSTDGASWATATTLACTVAGILETPTRLILISSGANAAQVSANLSPTSAWSTTTGSPSSVTPGASLCRMCYIPATSPGRAVAVHPSSGIFTLDEGSTAWAGRTSSARSGVAWSGARVVGITAGSAVASLSTDGITWVDSLLPEALSAGQGNVASNALGVVVISGCPSGLMVSDDHGLTFRLWQIPGIAASDLWRVQFSGGYFFVPTTSGLAISPDGKHWFIAQTMLQPMVTSMSAIKRGSTIVAIPGVTATAYTLVESATEFELPNSQRRFPANSGNPIADELSYIKRV